jgi:hypothetical protein
MSTDRYYDNYFETVQFISPLSLQYLREPILQSNRNFVNTYYTSVYGHNNINRHLQAERYRLFVYLFDPLSYLYNIPALGTSRPVFIRHEPAAHTHSLSLCNTCILAAYYSIFYRRLQIKFLDHVVQWYLK